MIDPDCIEAALAALADPDYRSFQLRLLPGMSPARVLGVRIPVLRRYARTLDAASVQGFLRALPHGSYDADNLHAILLAEIRDAQALEAALDAFLPWVDNWATCDICRPPMPDGGHAVRRAQITRRMADAHPFTVRFGIEQLMLHFLGAHFCADDPDTVMACADRFADAYYVVMMAAWYLAEALVWQPDAVLSRLDSPACSADLRQKTVRKALDSRRIPAALKAQLRAGSRATPKTEQA